MQSGKNGEWRPAQGVTIVAGTWLPMPASRNPTARPKREGRGEVMISDIGIRRGYLLSSAGLLWMTASRPRRIFAHSASDTT